MAAAAVGVGVVGCGAISAVYLENLGRFKGVEVVACADIDLARARSRAVEFGVARACKVDELLGLPEVDLVVNLTVPRAHGPVALAALRSGKSVYNEKPLATTREDGRALLRLARRKGLLVGGAPDTFLGSALQTCRRVIDQGLIGEPVAVVGTMLGRGHESWHPNPAFFYQPGGGPLLDMGPYYLTAMVALLGPVRRVTGAARASFKERLITSQPRAGKKIRVQVPTHAAGVLEFATGAIGTMTASFDVWAASGPHLQVFGSDGSLLLPDPNNFGGEVLAWRPSIGEWTAVDNRHRYGENWRGLGAADLGRALQTGRAPRAGGALAFHVLDIMQAIHDSARAGAHVRLGSSCDRPAPMPPRLAEGRLD